MLECDVFVVKIIEVYERLFKRFSDSDQEDDVWGDRSSVLWLRHHCMAITLAKGPFHLLVPLPAPLQYSLLLLLYKGYGDEEDVVLSALLWGGKSGCTSTPV